MLIPSTSYAASNEIEEKEKKAKNAKRTNGEKIEKRISDFDAFE